MLKERDPLEKDTTKKSNLPESVLECFRRMEKIAEERETSGEFKEYERLNNNTQKLTLKIKRIDKKEVVKEDDRGRKISKTELYLVIDVETKTDNGMLLVERKVRVDNLVRGWFDRKRLVSQKVINVMSCLEKLKEEYKNLEFLKVTRDGVVSFELAPLTKDFLYSILEKTFKRE